MTAPAPCREREKERKREGGGLVSVLALSNIGLTYPREAGSLEASGSTCGILGHSRHRTGAGPKQTSSAH